MFKLESYITPILLSYVDKYIKNFRPEDSQVSLWGGDASFHNLDLRLEVLEQELQLPFSFVSGHIHELLIHVPWTKIASEPITITINTIECILKLRGTETPVSDKPPPAKEKPKKNVNKRQQIEAPPGYVQLLINKIVSNIRIYCNNLILKYVEEDIVLSMNVKLLTFESADEKWKPAYTEVSPAKVLLRKLIAINDLTVCLDKRNASGKIDVYQEPMLYRCSMVIHLLRSYHTSNVKSSSITRLDIYCNSMEFSMTEQQIPMLLRLIFLLQVLQAKQLKSDIEINAETENVLDTTTGDYNVEKQSLAGWAWSFVPSILPVRDAESANEFEIANLGQTTHIGFYVDNASLTFKVSESSNEKSGYYSQRKIKYWPIISFNLQGIFMESIAHGKQWSQVSTGISQMLLLPLSFCPCSVQDISETVSTIQYLKAGSVSMIHKSDSLFDVEAPENKGQRKSYNISWDKHIDMTTEAILLERSPALAIDYVYQLIVPDDMTSENLSELGSDLEFSNLSERALLRVVVGPLRLKLCSGFLHRLSSLKAAASAYDYIPYSIPKPEPDLQDLPPPSEDDYDALMENIPTRVWQVTILAPVIEFQLMDHPYFEASKGYLFKKRKKLSTHVQPCINTQSIDLPKITLECQCIDMRTSNPMYYKRLVRTTCQLPDPPEELFNACYADFSLKVIGFCSRLIISNKQITILTPSSASYHHRKIIIPEYWINPSIPHEEVTFNSESIAITGTYPKILLVTQIIDKFVKMDCQDSLSLIQNSSLLQDATRNYGLVYLEFCIEGINLKKVNTNSTVAINASLGSIKAFIFEPIDFAYSTSSNTSMSFYSTREIQQVLIISGPELKDDYKRKKVQEEPLLTLTMQFPLNPENQNHAPILIFNMRDVRICIDPLLCKWLLYAPRNVPPKTEVLFDNPRKLSRSFSDMSTHETPRRSRTPYESIHSSLDQTFLPPQKIENVQEEADEIDFQERIYNFLKRWFDVWKGLLIYGDISQCTIYCPVKSLSAVGSQGIQQAVEEAMKKPDPPDIFILTLPSAMIRNSSHRDNLMSFIKVLPISLPEYLWTKHKSTFPWSVTVSDFCAYTWQNGERMNCIAPVSLTATVGMSTKSNKSNTKSLQDVSMENISNINLTTNKNDIGSLGVCIHIDMTPIVISVSELQVCLIASILHGLVEVAYNILPDANDEPIKPELIPNMQAQESALSPTLLKSVESVSEKTPHVYTDELQTDNIKLTAWIQWTITKFSIELLAHEANDISVHDFKYSRKPTLKFVIDAEDIVSSLDFQSVYLKLKSKIGTASIMHYVLDKESNKWKLGDFLGFVMRSNEEHFPSDRQEDTSFANVTLTRASCQHTHDLWGTNKKNKNQQDENEPAQIHSRYITEIVVNLQPIDILISPTTLKNYYLVIEPLLRIPTIPSKPKQIISDNVQVSNRTLPLSYIEFHGFRLIVPSAELGQLSTHDTCVFQIKRINLTPTAVNPICRIPCRPDIYQQAAQARILNIPGSDVEDRQYQLDILGVSMDTGSWEEISQVLQNHGKHVSLLRTMSENPALEWNSLGKAKLSTSPDVTFWPIIAKFDISIVAAPAMIYKHDVICGHSIEINFISDIKLTISLTQIRLLVSLLNESSYVFGTLTANCHNLKRPKVIFPYPNFKHNNDSLEETEIEIHDSGIDTSDLRSTTFSMKTKDNSFLKKGMDVSEKSVYTSMASPSPGFSRQVVGPSSFVPLDVLITGGTISLVVYDYEDDRHRISGLAFIKSAYENESDMGYEASEEGSSDERQDRKHSKPLFYFSLSQPNALLSDTPLGRKIQISCFDICTKISEPSHKILKGIPSCEDFNISLLETKSGEPHPDTGVLPAFFTLKWSKGIGKQATMDLEIAKPTKIICSISRCKYLLGIQERVLMIMKSQHFDFGTPQEVDIPKVETKPPKQTDYYSKFKEIKQRFMGLSHLNIKLSQIIFALETDDNIELSLSLGKLENYLSIYNRPEKLTNNVSFDCMTVGLKRDGEIKLILNPWSFNLEVVLFWESWQNANSNPQIQLSAESDCIMIDVSPDKINCLELFLHELTYFSESFPATKSEEKIVEIPRTTVGEKEQHYKDDLRAGAFQFVDSNSNDIDELPLPYQVMFWNRNISAMAWRYPQPRALTKVRVFPVPFKISTGNEEDQQVLCHLEYWSECHGCYQSYTQFYLSETEMCHLELPKSHPQPAVACIWRVVLTTPSIKEYNNHNQSRVLISPRALAGCIRVDSYFNKNLIPDLTMALHIGSIQVNLFNYFNKKVRLNLPDPLKNYTPDLFVPDYQLFLSLTVDNANAYLATWNFEMAVFDVSATTKSYVLDYNFLTQQLLLEPFTSKLEISLSKSLGVNFISKPIHVLFGASAAHTLTVSAQMWSQCFDSGINIREDDALDLVIMTHYVVCNDTNINLRFGQAGMEDIFLPSRFCHLYSWRSQKCKQMMRLTLEEKRWIWSEPFRVDIDGTQMCKISDDETAVIIITVRSLSATQKQVVFSGQLAICNTLVEHFEMKILEASENEFKVTQSYVVRGKTTPPSMLIDGKKEYFLRLRFFGLESAWSGDIPLKENTKCAQPWLVKVPLQERGQFLSIWCRIVVQNYPKGIKILAMLWPLFMIRSNLPISAKVHIETPTLNVHLESTVRGLGEYQQLYCPGTIDHSHQLTFHLDNSTTTKNPYVPLNYSLVDQKEFFKKPENEVIDDILAKVHCFDKNNWTYFNDDNEDVELTADEQPLTHVQVRYQNACKHSSSLLVELLPWCLLANTLGCPIALIINEQELCRVSHLGLVTPPKLEDTFHIGVGIGGTWNMSPPLQLAKSNWSQTFYMPQITGTIPVEGNIKTVVKCEPYICIASINSTIKNEIRLLKVTSSHVLTSFMQLQLELVCFAVPDTQTDTHLPRQFERYSTTIPANLNKSKTGISIIQWYSLGKNNDDNTNYALYISLATKSKSNWTCPVRVDKKPIRRSVAIQNDENSIPIVIVTQELKGQTFISLHHDLHPQLLIQNHSGTKIYCAQSGIEQSVTVNDSEHFNWLCAIEDSRSCYYSMPIVSEMFPELPQENYPEVLVLASDPEGDPQGFLWSNPINVTSFNDQFVRIPFYGDVKVSVKYSAHTINVIIESVSQVEISARDIRIRLSMHENENVSTRQGRITHDVKKVDSTTSIGSYYSAEESISSSSSDLIAGGKSHHPRLEIMPIVNEKPINTDAQKYLTKDSLRVLVFIKSIALTLTSDLDNGGCEKTEVASLTCDNISLSINQSDVSDICFSISDIQIDNQIYSRGSYDYPVILCGRESHQTNNLKTLNVPISQLVNQAQSNYLLKIDVKVETWNDFVQNKTITDVSEIKLQLLPISMYIEDTYVMKMLEIASELQPTNLLLWPKKVAKTPQRIANSEVSIPAHLLCGAAIVANPLNLNSFQMESISLLLSVHSSIKLYIALDQSPLAFGRFEKKRLFTTSDRLGHALTMHYLSGAIFGAGWVVGSLELLGSPGGLARAMGTGLRDFVTLPYYGFIQGPWAFLRGVSYGSASLMRHVTAGTLQSLTRLAASVARNLDRMTLDEDHLRRTEEFRRQRPQGVTQGFIQGLTGLGISLLGAVGGIAHHPLQSVMADGASPKSLVAGVGKGIVGVFTKPLSGAAELVALTGEGLLQGAGWNNLPKPRMKPVLNHIFSTPNSLLKYKWKFIQTVSQSNILFVTEATALTNTGQYDAVALVLTTEALVIIDTDEDMTQRVLSLSELTGLTNNDQSLLCIKLDPPKINVKQNIQGENMEMDPVSRARVADYVRNTVGLMQLTESTSPEHSEMSISPDLSPSGSPNGSSAENTTLTFYVNPQSRNYFLCLLALAKQQTLDYNFTVL